MPAKSAKPTHDDARGAHARLAQSQTPGELAHRDGRGQRTERRGAAIAARSQSVSDRYTTIRAGDGRWLLPSTLDRRS